MSVQEAATASDCRTLQSSGSVESYKQCAFLQDSQVASTARGSDFERAFQAATSGTFDQFLARVSEDATPRELLGQLFSANPKSNAAQVQRALDQLESEMKNPDDPIRLALKLDAANTATGTSVATTPSSPPLSAPTRFSAVSPLPERDPTSVLLPTSVGARKSYAGISISEDIIQDSEVDLFDLISQRYQNAAEEQQVEELAPALPFNRYRTEQAPPVSLR
jgi:hypothetical protein